VPTRDRYAETFGRLDRRGEGAFIPFTVLGDPDLESSLTILRALVRAGADALELGVPFSDPVADGPTIQAADIRALAAGARPAGALSIVRALRGELPDLPIGLLVYANLVLARGPRAFYGAAAAAGVDSVLVADAPTVEAGPFVEAAAAEGVLPVLIATPICGDRHLEEVARLTRGYTYVVTRAGVTGADEAARTDHRRLCARLRELGAAPPVLGFGISRPEQVRGALDAGAAGAISGSAVVRLVEENLGDLDATLRALEGFVAAMKAATRGR
jgi:tryptophan synthase alpha chain